MARPIIDSVKDGTKIIWQQVEDGMGEPALAVEVYSDSICITQEESVIRINHETIEQLCKILKGAMLK